MCTPTPRRCTRHPENLSPRVTAGARISTKSRSARVRAERARASARTARASRPLVHVRVGAAAESITHDPVSVRVLAPVGGSHLPLILAREVLREARERAEARALDRVGAVVVDVVRRGVVSVAHGVVDGGHVEVDHGVSFHVSRRRKARHGRRRAVSRSGHGREHLIVRGGSDCSLQARPGKPSQTRLIDVVRSPLSVESSLARNARARARDKDAAAPGAGRARARRRERTPCQRLRSAKFFSCCRVFISDKMKVQPALGRVPPKLPNLQRARATLVSRASSESLIT